MDSAQQKILKMHSFLDILPVLVGVTNVPHQVTVCICLREQRFSPSPLRGALFLIWCHIQAVLRVFCSGVTPSGLGGYMRYWESNLDQLCATQMPYPPLPTISSLWSFRSFGPWRCLKGWSICGPQALCPVIPVGPHHSHSR